MKKLVVECPHCRHHLQVDESQLGKSGNCPSCKGNIIILGRQTGSKTTLPENVSPLIASSASHDTTPILTIKPVFITWLHLLPTLIATTLAYGSVVLVVKFMKLAEASKDNISLVATLTGVIGFSILVGSALLHFYTKKRTYAKTEYKFYRDHLEYSEGFWTVIHKTLRYDSITEVAMQRGILQRICGLGTIFLMPAGLGIQLSTNEFGGIRMLNIAEPDEVYRKVKQLLKR